MRFIFTALVLFNTTFGEIYDVSIPENDTASYNYADFRMWVNDSTDTLRGIYWFMHPNNGDSRDIVLDEDYRVLTNNQDFALLGAHIFNMHMHTGIGDAVIAAMDSFAVLFSHNELEFVPFFINGYSWGGQFGYHFTKWIPERIVGFITQKGGFHDTTYAGAATEVPGLMFVAENDPQYRIDNLTGIFLDHRPLGAKWMLAMEQDAGHTPVEDYDFLNSFFNTVTDLRLPDSLDVFQPIQLHTLPDSIGWFGDQSTWIIGSHACYDDFRDSSSWFPSKTVGEYWQNFVSEGTITDTSDCVEIEGPWAWIDNGYQSGIYMAGDTIHIWSELDPSTMTFHQWTGDTSLLNDPAEWHTSFIMPDNDVSFYAHQDSVGTLDFDYEIIQGVDNPKNVYYKFPTDPIGTIFFFHGGSGNAGDIIQRVEVVQFFHDARDAGYGLVATESEDRTLNDPDGDGRTPWILNTWTADDNIDIGNIQALIDTFVIRGFMDAQNPVYSLGVSNGGNFSSVVAHALNFNAAAMYSSQGNPPALYQITEIPTIFCPAKYDPALGGGNWAARMNYDSLQSRGVSSVFYELDRSPAYPQRFARVPGIDLTISNNLFNEFQGLGLIDDDNYFTVLDDSIAYLFMNYTNWFPNLDGLDIGTIRHVMDQIKVMTADHSFFADFNERVLDFFGEHTEELANNENAALPKSFKLYAPYPNPFNPVTTIRFSVRNTDLYSLQMYDITGRMVETLVNSEIEPGVHAVQWNAVDFSSGIYFVELVSGEQRQVQKLILIK